MYQALNSSAYLATALMPLKDGLLLQAHNAEARVTELEDEVSMLSLDLAATRRQSACIPELQAAISTAEHAAQQAASQVSLLDNNSLANPDPYYHC